MALFTIRLTILCAIIILFIPGCEHKPSEIRLNEKLKFKESEYQLTFKNRFKDENLSVFLKDSSFQYIDTLKDFYSTKNFQPVFIKSFEEKSFVDSLLALFGKAEEHGLIRELYHFNLIVDQFYSAINDTINNPDRLNQLANCELLVSDAILKYAYHMRYGVVNPTKIFLDSYYLPVVDSSNRDLFEPLKQNNIIQYLQDIQPKSEKYKKLQIALRHFNTYKNIEWKIIPILNKKLEPGDKDSSIQLIAGRLITLGFLDTSKIKISDYTVYDSLLLNPVKKFQQLNGLTDDGVIGKTTVEKLNITAEEYIGKIKINLERFRWYDYSDTSQYVFVNIPDFRLHVIENKKELFNIKVCTGKKRPANFEKRLKIYKKTKRLRDRPDDWETPCIYSEISNLILNPTWTVPNSIIREEILAGIKKDSSYLDKKNFKVYKDGVEISHNEVNLKELSLEYVPYRIVQDPGAGNALGKIKFMFKNPFGVYLHDTPTRAPFTYSNRAVSHGCIRVEKPLQFAEYILRGHSKWNIDYLKIEIGQKVDDKTKVDEYKKKRSALRKNASFGKTTEVVLDKKIPLFVDYYTAWVDDNGEINFRDDVYNQDKILMEYLFPEK
jgi:L,D-transpeptidase YcbB